jgi:23S rRNA (guanosine2251-2'-O)-methyltransferase
VQKKDLIFGMRPVIEAIHAGQEIHKVLLRKGGSSDNLGDLLNLMKTHEIPAQFVPVEKLNRITSKNHQGVIAFLSSIEYDNLEKLIPMLYEEGRNPLILLLENVTDVRNFGSIARSAECAGVDALVIPSTGSAQINSDAVKTSAGALNYIKVCRTRSLKESVVYLKNSGFSIIAATEKASKVYYHANLTGPTAIVLGAEDTGLSGEILRLADELVCIPMLGNIASLNVSVASGILLFEVIRQRKQAETAE